MSFEALGLDPVILSALQEAGFKQPTTVQEQAIPAALAGHDLMVSAQTGSGKTAAFMLPSLQRIAHRSPNKGKGVQILVLTPTRELAMQISDATRSYGAGMTGLRSATVVGGVPYGAQLKALSRRVDVLVATPGRLIDHLKAKRVDLSGLQVLVLDEADRMLDMGFIEDMETIVAATPDTRQTLLFSATLDNSIARLARDMLRDPQRIDVMGAKNKHENITQSLLYADNEHHKLQLLNHLLRDTSLNQAIVFTATKRGADQLAEQLSDQGFPAAPLHGDMNQRQRTRTLDQLHNRRLRILVATDVAARGIDVPGISHAINFDLPMQPEDYTHRIGRTGRAGNHGSAFTLATHTERHKIKRLERFLGQPIPPQVIEGLEPRKMEAAKPARKRPSSGGRPFSPGARSGGPGKRSFDDKPGYEGKRSFGDKPAYEGKRSFGDKPDYEGKRSFGDKPGYEGKRSFGDKPGYEGKRSFGDKPGYEGKRSFGDKPGYEGKRSFGDKPGYEGRPSARPGKPSGPGSYGAGRPHGKPASGPGRKPARFAGRTD